MFLNYGFLVLLSVVVGCWVWAFVVIICFTGDVMILSILC